ncbi:hypothetical protein Dsin_023382 [Dipteronia sinensis]|uniref:WLM domain-containing protein n=1 Tax=Dipteronia sinensis TaxID=43782 RepID=A0AAE0A450_9ROSI|nr:hypothetical protein Dsin_023382 [Dipteronia sinensis]
MGNQSIEEEARRRSGEDCGENRETGATHYAKTQLESKLLSEFCPSNASLLGLNVGGGVHVKLRLLRPNMDLDFYPFDQVIDTMLHELCHNAYGPHNANSYKLWDELRKIQECKELMSKGITGTGEGFDLPGKCPSGPKRLGGDSTIMVDLSSIQAAAMAAERRLQDDIWCGSQAFGDGGSNSDMSEDIVYTGQSTGNSKLSGGYSAPSDAISPKRSRESSNSSGSSFVDLSADASTSGPILNHDSKSPKNRKNNYISQSNRHSNSSFVDISAAPSSASMCKQDAMHIPKEPAKWRKVGQMLSV